MELSNYSMDNKLKKLLLLNNLIAHTEKQHLRIVLNKDYLQDTDPNKQDLLSYTDVAHGLARDELFHITLLTITPNRSDSKDWKDMVVTEMQRQGATYYDLLSTALTTRAGLTLVFKMDNIYLSFNSYSTGLDDMYYLNLGCMLQEHSADHNLVLRITKAIQTREPLVLSQEETNLIIQYNSRATLRELYNAVDAITKPVRPTEHIRSLKTRISNLMVDLENAKRNLREAELKDFAILSGLHNRDATMEEFKDYLESIQAIVLDTELYTSNTVTEFNITIRSNLFIPETDIDFIKPQAIASPHHALHNRPKVIKIVTDTIAQKIRLPITATYRIIINSNGSIDIRGVNEWYYKRRADTEHYISNKHIDRFNCFDGYKAMMLDKVRSQEPIGLFEVMRQCTSSINVFDSTVMDVMSDEIQHYTGELEIKKETGWENISMGEYLNEITQTE